MENRTTIELVETPAKRVQRHVLDVKYFFLGIASQWLLNSAAKPDFEQLETFCCFVGHGRSGGTLVGALLNAHPNVVMSNELNALRRLRLGLTGRQLYRLIYLVSRRQVQRGSRGGGGYSYAVPDQWQGSHRALRVIGDRKAGATAFEVMSHPETLSVLRDKVALKKKFIHVVRNPFDTIATTFHKTRPLPGESIDAHLTREIGNYFARCRAVSFIEQAFDAKSIHYLHHLRLIEDPSGELRRLCEFLDIEPHADYLAGCAGIVQTTPHQSRSSLTWSDHHSKAVTAGLGQFHWLAGYGFS